MSLKKAGLVGLLAAAALAIPASAATVEDLQAQVNALLAQLAALQGGSSSSAGCYSFTTDLTIGSTGADVTALQSFLESKGYFTYAGAKGYFGAITQAAVAAWQSANGVAPAAGYFGAISRAKYNTMCGGTSMSDDDDDDDDNGDFFTGDDEGSLENFDQISKYAGEEVGEDEEDVTVLGVEFEADGADQMIERVTVTINTPSAAAEDDLGDFIEDVSVWLDGEELGRMDVEDASYDRADDEYVFRFVGLDGIVADGDTGELLVAVTGPSSVNGDIEGEGWSVGILENGIRASSPNGVTESYDGEDPSNLGPETFTVETFSSANDVELKASKSSDNPDEQTVVGDSNDEFMADLLGFELEAEGSDIEVFSLEFDLTTSAPSVVQQVSELTLTCGGDSWSETPATTTVFADLEFMVDEGDSVECMLSAEMLEIDGTVFAEGDTLSADLDVSETDAEDESGEGLVTGDLTGSANGYDQTFISEGLEISNIEADAVLTFTADDASETSTGKFTVEFDVTANDSVVYLDKSATATTSTSTLGISTAGEGLLYVYDIDGADELVINSAILECVSNCGNNGDNSGTDFFIDEGDTETYRLTVSITGDDDPDPANFKIWLASINWATADATADQFYTSNLGEDTDADTGYLFLNAL